MTEAVARTGDPASSHHTMAVIDGWVSVKSAIMQAVRDFSPIPCDDTDITQAVGRLKGEPVQRNVVARARGLLEREGQLTRVGLRHRGDRRTLHFRLPSPGDDRTMHISTRPKFHETGRFWCAEHHNDFEEGEPVCDEYLGITRYHYPEIITCERVSLHWKEEPNA